MSEQELTYTSDKLPARTLARSVFDQHLMRLSDRGGASQLIGEAWSDIVADELSSCIGGSLPTSRPELLESALTSLHRLDTLPGVAARASSLGLKNPDFLAHIQTNGLNVVIGIDAKFSIETARDDQVSSEAISRLFNEDELLAGILPTIKREHTFARGLFVSPDYSLTRAMFRQRMGHRRMSVSRRDVVLVDVSGRKMFCNTGNPAITNRLIALDSLPQRVFESLLAGQYYFRLARAMHGLALDEQLPLFGHGETRNDESYVEEQVAVRAESVDSAWSLVLNWDRDVDHIRRQRKALHQVVGTPLSGAELRDIADVTLAELIPEARPSRNQIRKALGSMFTQDVAARTGVILPTIDNFPAELERVASISRDIANQYRLDIVGIVRDMVIQLAEERLAESHHVSSFEKVD